MMICTWEDYPHTTQGDDTRQTIHDFIGSMAFMPSMPKINKFWYLVAASSKLLLAPGAVFIVTMVHTVVDGRKRFGRFELGSNIRFFSFQLGP